jgi:predicted ester cyclase
MVAVLVDELIRDGRQALERCDWGRARELFEEALQQHERADALDGLGRALHFDSDLHVDVEHQFTDGDYVATRVTVRGTHDGDLMGTPPTGREVAFSMLTISRCENGRIAGEWEITDTMALLQQVGAVPDPVAG